MIVYKIDICNNNIYNCTERRESVVFKKKSEICAEFVCCLPQIIDRTVFSRSFDDRRTGYLTTVQRIYPRK